MLNGMLVQPSAGACEPNRRRDKQVNSLRLLLPLFACAHVQVSSGDVETRFSRRFDSHASELENELASELASAL